MEDHARRTPDEGSKSLQRVKASSHSCERTINKLNRRHHKHGLLKQSQSPSNPKAFVTPTRTRPRYGSSGASQLESPDPVQDIIWESTSPPPVWNGPGPEKTPQIIDIVNRIAPKERDKGAQSSPFLQWLGKDAISCTPDVPTPRVRRKSVRQNSVEDLKKLALEFDLSFGKGQQQQQQQQQQSGPGSDNPPEDGPHQKGLQLQAATALDEELNALFDSSTQHISRPLSQGSSACSQESRTGSTAVSSAAADDPSLFGVAGPKKSNTASLSTSATTVHADRANSTMTRTTAATANVASTKNGSGKGDFDDDWENDDLLNDSFVLEMTQHPVMPDSAPAPGSATAPSRPPPPPPPPQHPVSKVTDPPIKVNPSASARTAVPGGRAGPSRADGINVRGRGGSSANGGGGGGRGGASGVQMGTRAEATAPTNPSSTFVSEPGGLWQHKHASASSTHRPCLDTSDAAKHERGQSTHAPSSSRHTEEEKKKEEKANEATGQTLTNIRKQTTGLDSRCPGAQKSSEAGVTDRKDNVKCPTSASEDTWDDDGDDADDDLLYQVCDVVERLSASQEEAREVAAAAAAAAVAGRNTDKKPSFARQLSMSPSHLVPARPTKSTFTASSSWPPPQKSFASSTNRPQHTFARSLSMPSKTSTSVVTTAVLPNGAPKAQAPVASAGAVHPNRTAPPTSSSHRPNQQQQHRFTQLKPQGTQQQQHTNQSAAAAASGTRGPKPTSTTHHSAAKRPLQEPRPLANKVFVPNQRPVRCSAAEIERKKQDAIARRKLRLEASQNTSTPT
ncbi:ewing's tumor-associated antigen 1 homolog [Engraulis encrasicolus]|uniref:ewing's tumor-associated antigen 1 homolog n=1 Tax=Engraulis encrasicolus TaxID=184585 RepID=UPI002FD4F0CD